MNLYVCSACKKLTFNIYILTDRIDVSSKAIFCILKVNNELQNYPVIKSINFNKSKHSSF